MELRIKLEGLKEAREIYNPEKVGKAAVRAINRIAGPAKTAAIKVIKENYNVPARERLNETITVRRANYTTPVATITAKGRVPGLQHYVKGRQTKTGVNVLVRKDRGIKKFRHGFLAPGANGKGEGLWHREAEKVIPSKGRYAGRTSKRTGKPIMRQPLKRHFGPDVVGMIKQEGIKKIEERVNERWEKEFSHELEWEMKKK